MSWPSFLLSGDFLNHIGFFQLSPAYVAHPSSLVGLGMHVEGQYFLSRRMGHHESWHVESIQHLQ